MARYYGLRRTTRVLAVYLALIIVSTIYFGWHYVTDDIAGVLIALTAVQLGKWTVFPPRSCRSRAGSRRDGRRRRAERRRRARRPGDVRDAGPAVEPGPRRDRPGRRAAPLWWRLLATPGGDIAAQDAWAAFARAHPGSAYDLAWYGGMHPVSYSAISPYLMAVLGVRPTMVVVGTLSAGLLALLLERSPHVRHPMLPAVFGALALTGNAVSGRVTFGLGLLFGLAALVATFAWPARLRLRVPVIVALAALTTAASAVAGLLLGLVAAALWLTGERRLAYAIGLPPLVVVAVSAWLFPLSGVQPMSWYSALLPTAAGLSAVLLFPRDWRLLRMLGVVYLVAVQMAWLMPSPVGTNINRLGLIFAGVGLVATLPGRDWVRSLAGVRLGRTVAAGMLGAALITSVSWQVGLAARDAINTAPPESLSLDLQPLVDQLQDRGAGLGRVEVVPTASHREATALAAYANLARGWNRQADAARNRLFYRDQPLTADAYQRWLRRWAVRFVVLSTATPDAAPSRRPRSSRPVCPTSSGSGPTRTGCSTRSATPRRWPPLRRGSSTSTPRRSRCTPPSPARSWCAWPTPGGSVSSTRRARPCRPRPRACPASPVTARWRTRATTGWCCTPARRAPTGSGRPTRCRAGPPAPDHLPGRRPALEPADLVAQLVVATLERQHRLDAGQVQAVGQQRRDAPDLGDVGGAVAPGAPRRAVRRDELLRLVRAQHRRAHAGELGGHGHAVDGVVVGGRSVVRRPHPVPPSCPKTHLGQVLEISRRTD
jgi:hypothetical protein